MSARPAGHTFRGQKMVNKADVTNTATVLIPADSLVEEALSNILDDALREDITNVISHVKKAELALANLDLRPFEYPDCADSGKKMWAKVRPKVLSIMTMMRELAGVLRKLMGAMNEEADESDDILDLDHLVEETDSTPIQDRSGHQVDMWVSRALEQDEHSRVIRCSASGLGKMIEETVFLFGKRLSSPGVISERWNLIGDLQEMRGRFLKILSALRYTSLEPFCVTSREEIAPNYHTEIEVGLSLRRALGDIRHRFFLAAAHTTSESTEQRKVAIACHQLIKKFLLLNDGQHLRATDRRTFLDARAKLTYIIKKQRYNLVATVVDDFVRFLEVIRMINFRDVLVEHDKLHIGELINELVRIRSRIEGDDKSRFVARFDDWFEKLEVLYGKDAILDALIRDNRDRNILAEEHVVLNWRLQSIYDTLNYLR